MASSSSSSSGAFPTGSSSLMPNHSADLASELSAHLNSALSDDKSYQQMNDAKMRGMSAMVGWDQFHGMVLTAHLKPVNLRAEPIDEMAKGVPRQRKLEQARQRNVVSAAVADASGNAIDEKQAAVNAAFLKQLDMQLPNNAHEWARDWKRLAANGATGDELQQLRYRYLLTLPLSSPSTSLLKGGLPLDIIADSIAAIHSRWTQQQQPDSQHVSDAVEAAGDATAAIADATGATAATACTESAPAPADSLPPPSDVSQLLTLLQRIAGMSSFSIALFSLTAGDKARLAEILDIAQRAVESDSFREWQRDLQAPAAATAATAAASPATETAAASPVDSDSSTQAAASTAAPAVPAAAAVAAPSRRDFDHTPALDNNTRALVNDNAAAAPATAARNVPSTPTAAASPTATVDAQLVELLRTKFKLPKQ